MLKDSFVIPPGQTLTILAFGASNCCDAWQGKQHALHFWAMSKTLRSAWFESLALLGRVAGVVAREASGVGGVDCVEYAPSAWLLMMPPM